MKNNIAENLKSGLEAFPDSAPMFAYETTFLTEFFNLPQDCADSSRHPLPKD